MRHWLNLRDRDPAELAELVALARRIKAARDAMSLPRAMPPSGAMPTAVRVGMSSSAATDVLRGRILGMVFFNPSLRTRTSFEAAMLRFGGHAIALSVGGDTWKLEFRDGVVMDGPASEHVKEAAPVLSRYCDVLGVRTFAAMKNAAEDAADATLHAFARYATVPVISLESALEHPCQGLADWLTMDEKLGGTRGRRFTLTWAPQASAVPMAVPHSALLAAAAAGMQVTLAHPPGYDLNADIVERAAQWAAAAGTKLEITHDQPAACRGADILYVKSWGAARFYGDAAAQKESFRQHSSWMVDTRHLGPQTKLMHCLPVRRNVVISDAALDDPRCIVVDQAENRLWAQVAVLSHVLKTE